MDLDDIMRLVILIAVLFLAVGRRSFSMINGRSLAISLILITLLWAFFLHIGYE